MICLNPDLELHWDAVQYKRQRAKRLVRIYMGSFLNSQWLRFSVSLPSIAAMYNLQVEILSIQDVNKRRMSESDFVNYFLAADIHFILGHAHQGASIRALGWNMDVLKENLQRLKFHNGFPSGLEVQCPVFLQDKFEYLTGLRDYANPTLRIDLRKNGDYTSLHDEIIR